MKKTVEYPQFVWGGIRANHRAYPLDENVRIFGADSETARGEPMTIQASDGDEDLFAYVRPKTVFTTFRDWIFPRCRTRGVNVCYFHYLKFDLPVVFHQKRLAMYEQISEIEFELDGVSVEMLYGKVNKATLRYEGKTLHVLDSWAFTQAGLAASLKMYKVPFKKMDKPPRLGHVRYDELAEDDPERLYFERYSKMDARSEQGLGVAIMGFHKRYGVRPSISLPQFAGRVFRHHFFKPDEVIPAPPPDAVQASQSSYHGGMNDVRPGGPFVVEDAYEADISSAYPYAMSELPQFVQGSFARVKDYDDSNVGVYKVSGRQVERYPIIFTEEFKPVVGDFKDVWITGHELKRALRAGVDLEVTDGWVWLHDRTYRHNPLREYVRHFYDLKEKTDRSSADYYFYKTCMNALYGKFCAAVEVKKLEVLAEFDPESGKKSRETRVVADDYRFDPVLGKCVRLKSTFRAGMLTNFFIASQITGFVRGYLWDLETKYESFHSATDAIKTTKKVPAVPGLGGLKLETFGRCYVFRNKLYLHFAESADLCGHKRDKKDEDGNLVNAWRYECHDGGQHLCKYGLHGFKGNVRDLYGARKALLAGAPFEYSYKHMVGLREGFRRREAICAMVDRKEVLNLWAPNSTSVSVAA